MLPFFWFHLKAPFHMNETIQKTLQASISYEAYIKLTESLVAAGKTSGPLQAESLIYFTKLNLKRMQRINKTAKVAVNLIQTVNALSYPTLWVVIAETWCGDAAQNLPYIAKLAAGSNDVSLGIVMRDEHPDFMDLYLTNGSRSIPKLIIYNAKTMQKLAQWGPRPSEVQQMVESYKHQVGVKPSMESFAEELHRWYAQNKNKALESELLTTFHIILNTVTQKSFL